MSEPSQLSAIQLLQDWAKWLITIESATIGGCILALGPKLSSGSKFFIVSAVICFTLSVFVTAVLLGSLPSLVDNLSRVNSDQTTKPLYHYPIGSKFSLGTLIRWQYLLLAAGLICLFLWVSIKALSLN